MSNTMPINVTVSHKNGKFAFAMSGEGVTKPDEIRVEGTEPVVLEFHAVRGEGVREVEFLPDAKKSCLVGAADDPACPPQRAGDEFEPGEHGGSRSKLKVKDKKTRNGTYRFQLTVVATPTEGKPQVEPWDPVIINQ